LYQHTPNERIATKPPLVGWVSVAFFRVTRSWELAWRLPSFLAAAGIVVVLLRAGTRAYSPAAGVLAVGAFGLNLWSPRVAMLVRTDMPLALVVFLLGLGIFWKIRERGNWGARDRWIVFALLTAAMLIKGPIVYAFLLPGLVAFQWLRRDDHVSAWCGWWPWVASLMVFLLWVAGGVAWVPGFYEQVVLREFAGRFGETVHRSQPLYFYLPHLLLRFLPWSMLLLGWGILSCRRTRGRIRQGWRALPPEIAWLVLWSASGLLVMSLIPSKRFDRLYPILPPLCLLVAAQFSRALRGPRASFVRRWSALTLVAAGLLASAHVATNVFASYRGHEDSLVRFGAAVRKKAEKNGWRYGVIGRNEEGLLLYLRREHFLEVDDAIRRWQGGELDALVLPAEKLPALREALPDAIPADLEATINLDQHVRHYLLLRRADPPRD
ncbi:MAG: hypothetical protein ACR2NX_15415, partial [Chthoniobacterales bacterium]